MAADEGNVDLRVRVARAREAKKDVDAVGKSVRGLGKEVEKTDKKSRNASKGMRLFTGATNRAKTAVMGLGRAAGNAALFGVGALGYEVIKATKGWSEHMGIVRRTNAVIKSTQGVAGVTAKHVGNLSDALERKTGVDGDVIQSGANLLLTFTNVRNGMGKSNKIFDQATSTATNMSKALGQDTKASAIQLGKALNDPIKGVSALSKVGVSFDAQQKDQIKTLVESGKTMDAQKIILKELGKEFPPVPITPWERLQVVMRGVEDTIGKVVLPVFDRFVRRVTPPLERVATAASDIFDDKKLSWGEKFRRLGDVITREFGGFGTKAKDALIAAEPTVLEGVKSVFTHAASTAWTAFKEAPIWAQVGVGTFVATKLGLTGKAFTALTDLLTGKGGAAGKVASIFGDRGSTPMNPLYVVQVAGGGGGGGLKKAKDLLKKGAGPLAVMAEVLGTTPGMLVGMGITAGVAAGFIGYMGLTHNQNNPTKGPGASSPSNPKGHIPFKPGPLKRVGTEGNADPYRGYGQPTLGGKAGGGVVRRSGPYEVGERGTERMWLPAGTTVEAHGESDKPIIIHNYMMVNDQVLATAVHKAATRKASTR